MSWLLLPIITLFNGQVFSGDELPGWSPRPYESRETCQEAADRAVKYALPPEFEDIEWICIPR